MVPVQPGRHAIRRRNGLDPPTVQRQDARTPLHANPSRRSSDERLRRPRRRFCRRHRPALPGQRGRAGPGRPFHPRHGRGGPRRRPGEGPPPAGRRSRPGPHRRQRES
ncbi:hypothetical protein CD944_12905 [Brevundimonas diminuta]|nr:hypothetical protein CD944_12905 [Brevundimonas diminuta]